MSRSAGTGTPNWFNCPVQRRNHDTDRYHRRDHLIVLTGRTRPNPSNSRNTRVDDIEREYICTCGHRGWSRLKDVVRAASRSAVTARKLGIDLPEIP